MKDQSESGRGSRVDTLPDGIADLLVKSAAPDLGAIIGGRYQLVEHIADGAMGSVYAAENLAINLRVAVKLLRPELLLNSDFRRRFQQEAQAVAAIDHPNVVRFLDLIVGTPTFLVMEFVKGEALGAIVRREGKLPVDRVVRLGARVCRGLHVAHLAGVIHRDLKPANIMIGADDTPKIIDFGLAKLAAVVDEKLTRHGQIVGTPEYMAPEQIAGKPIDARTDVYAMGCLLFELIAGRTPFGSLDEVQVLYHQVNVAAPRLSKFVPDVPPTVDALIARALAKKPEDRFASMDDMAQALDRAIERRKSAPPPSNRKVIAGAAIATMVLGFGLGFALHRPPAARAPKAPPPPPAPTLFVTTTPEGAQVTIDGVALADETPLATVAGPGEHVVLVHKEGWGDVQRKVTLDGTHRDALTVTLPPVTRTVVVRTVPSGARVFLDDKLVAEVSPATLSIDTQDFHILAAEKPGFERKEVKLGPDDATPEMTLTLDPAKVPRASIQVDSADEAEVYVDGQDTGLQAPTLGIVVPLGKHTVELRDATGRKSAVVTVNATRAGVTERVSLGLK